MYIKGAILKKLRTYQSLSRLELAEILVTKNYIHLELIDKEYDPADIKLVEDMLLQIEKNNGDLPDKYTDVLAYRLEIDLDELLVYTTDKEPNEEEIITVNNELKIKNKETQIVCVTATKGGSTKTTSLTNIAAAFSEILGYNILVIDTDSQKDCTNTFGLTEEYEYNFKRLFLDVEPDALSLEELNNYIFPLDLYSGLSIIPSSNSMKYIESLIASMEYRKERMQEILLKLKKLNKFDIILIDTNNHSPILNNCIMHSSDFIFIPTIPESYPLRCTIEYYNELRATVFKYNSELKLLGVALTYVEKINAHKECAEIFYESELGEHIFKTTVRKGSKIKDSQNEGHPAVCLYPTAGVSKDYISLAKEMLKKIEHDACKGRCF